MSLKNFDRLYRFALMAVPFFALTVAAGASVRVGGSSLRANGQVAQGFEYTGSCPVALKFGWGLIGTEPTTVTYTFVRSDGGHLTTSRSVNLPNANQSVPIYDDWQLGANTPQFQNYSGWVQSPSATTTPAS